jgi:small subunit ribosomal protein S7e
MFTARTKIQKPNGAKPTALENQIAQYLFDLQNTSQDLQAELKDLYIAAAKEVTFNGGKKCVILFVPYRLLKDFRKIQVKLINELEKKLSGKQVVLIAQRRILKKETRKNRVGRQKRPYSRTLTNVHAKILEDLAYPVEIVGKRITFKVDGSRVIKIYLDPREESTYENRVDAYSAVYKELTGKVVEFLFRKG